MNEPRTDSHDAFNARHLTPAEVARDFIAPAHFYQMLGLNHCVLIGPRGSGKTTLLKMLQAEALRNWSGIGAGKDAKTDFIGMFVPADIRWARQLLALTKGIAETELQLRIYELAFGTALLLALVDTLSQLKEGSCFKEWGTLAERENEATLVQQLAELWAIPLTIPSIGNLKHGLRMRQTRLPGIAARIREGARISDLVADSPYVTSDWLEDLITGIDAINDAGGRRDQRWALLLDELEIIPPILLERIIDCLRSTSSNLIFKLALSPTGSAMLSQMDTKAPTAGNDFKLLRLWYDERKDLRVFAAQLLHQALTKRKLVDQDSNVIAELLGNSNIADDEDSERKGDGVGSRNEYRRKAFSDLVKVDSSFREFVEQKNIDLNNLHSGENGPLIRKIFPLVYFRSRILSNWDATAPRQRGGRVSLESYTGYPNILDLTEGNPRWILNLADELLAESKRKNQPVVTTGVQTAAVEAYHQRYASMLKVYPVDSGRQQTVYAFLSALANSIKQRLYMNSFSSDPAMSFLIDEEAINQYGSLLEASVHLGALVIMNPESSKKIVASNDRAGLIGSRVRLCYRLAPEFFLPLRSTSGIRLVSALGSDDFFSKQGVQVKKIDEEAKPKQTALSKIPVQKSLF
ncbi:hypothetical protein [Herbaspirillum huttiense]|uniref:ORC-CDC6 family AAA ATPase n=1 Tax=Herbaspirillum huttiense TaxID=863372 RepID=UPI002E78D10D|nr:hypothetical protein [Herbaspirillum huttiense]MEE1636929.1 hypothetical protein [Herbaspirillum huttiense NC40101]